MFQLECTHVVETQGDAMVTVRFGLLLNGQPTNQFAEFSLQPDFCEVGELFALSAADFEFRNSKMVMGTLADSLN